tara:strand:- start:50 stop:1159 length:1110 start_codon:yes stop_codon:yes gene_type:complete
MNKSVKKNKKNKVKGSVKKRHTKKNSIKKTLQKKYTKKNKRKIGGEGKKIKLAILLITTHGNLDNLQPLKKHEEDINVYKINATKPGVCNYIQDDELRDMGLKLSEFINKKKEKLKEEELEDFTTKLSKMLPEIDEVHKDAKKISKLALGKKSKVKSNKNSDEDEDSDEDNFFNDEDSDQDLKEYIKHSVKEEDTYKTLIWKKDEEYHDKAYTIILDERMETNENPYNNTIIFLGEEGLPALEYVEMAYNLRNTKEKAIEEKKEEEKKDEEKEEKEDEPEEQNVFNMEEISKILDDLQSEESDEKSDKSEESEEEYDTNKYISLSEILKKLKEKGYTDTIIIDLSCSVGYDPRSSRVLRRASEDNYGGK